MMSGDVDKGVDRKGIEDEIKHLVSFRIRLDVLSNNHNRQMN